MISVFADGSSTGRSNAPGGYGWVIVQDEEILAWSYGGSPSTTNNLMELEAAIQGLLAVLDMKLHDTGEPLELVSDSEYTLGLAAGKSKPKVNLQSALRLRALARETGCGFRWVKGHSGDKHNSICDQLAKQGKLENSQILDALGT